MRLVEFLECELVNDTMYIRTSCYVNPKHVVYVEEDEEHEGYSFIGLVGANPTIVKGTAKEVKEKLEGKRWLKILHLQ